MKRAKSADAPRALFACSDSSGAFREASRRTPWSSILSGHSVRAMSRSSRPAMTPRKYSKASMNFASAAPGGMSTFESF